MRRSLVLALALTLCAPVLGAQASGPADVVLAFDDPRGDAHGLHAVPTFDDRPVDQLNDADADLVRTEVHVVRDPATGVHRWTDVVFATAGLFDVRGSRIDYTFEADLRSRNCEHLTVLLSALEQDRGHDAQAIVTCNRELVRFPATYQVLADGRSGDAVVAVRVPAEAMRFAGAGATAHAIAVRVGNLRDDRGRPPASTSFALTD